MSALRRTELRHLVLASLSVGHECRASTQSQVMRATNSLIEAGLAEWVAKSVQPEDGDRLEPSSDGYNTLYRWDTRYGRAAR